MSSSIAVATGSNTTNATTLNTKMAVTASPCSRRRASTAGASALMADAPHTIVPIATRSAISRRSFSHPAVACATKNVAGSVTTRTSRASPSNRGSMRSVRTFSPIKTMAIRSSHLPVYRRPGSYGSPSRRPSMFRPSPRAIGEFSTSAPRPIATTTLDAHGEA